MNPLISVIVPVYNAEKYLQRCIDSIISQTFESFELILIDNSSTDSSLAICKKNEGEFAQIRVLCEEKKGASSARNTGLINALGEYVTFVDSDDTIEIDYLSELYKSIKRHDAGLSCIGFIVLRKSLNFAPEYQRESLEELFEFPLLETQAQFLLETNRLNYVCGKLYKMTIIRQHNIMFDDSFPHGQDTVFNCAYLPHCKKLSVSNYYGYDYYKYENGTLSSAYYEDKYCDEVKICDKLSEMLVKISEVEADSFLLVKRYIKIAVAGVVEIYKNRKMSRHTKVRLINNIIRSERFISSYDLLPANKKTYYMRIMRTGNARRVIYAYDKAILMEKILRLKSRLLRRTND